MSFRNRCTLSGGNGTINLSIPVVGGREQKNVIKEIRIDYKDNWQAKHWKTITACYNKSPWFDHFRDDLESLYETKYDMLVDWNLACFNWICDKMSISTPVSLSEEYNRKYDESEWKDWRNILLPATINRSFPSTKRYPQVFEDRFGFIPNLSVLDYLFCNGNRL